VQTLADLLSHAPLALMDGLRLAASIAALLQDLHQKDCRHGKLSPAHVRMAEGGPELVPPQQSFWSECSPEHDVRGFGGMLFEMVTGAKMPDQYSEAVSISPDSGGEGVEAVRRAAVRLSLKCMGHLSAQPNMRQAAMEVRLLWMQARRIEAHKPATPFLVKTADPPAPEAKWDGIVKAEVA
jgi:hypothetical protein